MIKNLLVTGGAGFIGSNYIHQYLDTFECLVNLDSLSYAGNLANLKQIETHPHYHFVQGDIADHDLVLHLLTQHDISAIVHFAAESHVDRSIDSPEPFIQTNVVGTMRLLDAARRHWKALPPEKASQFRFLHISTDEVFGSLQPEDPPFHENTPYEPRSPYSSSKAASDHLVRAYHHTYGLPILITNCSNNYGPYQFPEKLIPLMILNALQGKDLPVYGNGENVRDWLYVLDHCEAIHLVLNRGVVGETYCVGGKSELKNLELVHHLINLLDTMKPRADGQSYKTQLRFVTDRPGHDHRYAINFSKIQRELGWNPSTTLTEGLRKTVHWYLEHPEWTEDILSGRYQLQRLGMHA